MTFASAKQAGTITSKADNHRYADNLLPHSKGHAGARHFLPPVLE